MALLPPPPYRRIHSNSITCSNAPRRWYTLPKVTRWHHRIVYVKLRDNWLPATISHRSVRLSWFAQREQSRPKVAAGRAQRKSRALARAAAIQSSQSCRNIKLQRTHRQRRRRRRYRRSARTWIKRHRPSTSCPTSRCACETLPPAIRARKIAAAIILTLCCPPKRLYPLPRERNFSSSRSTPHRHHRFHPQSPSHQSSPMACHSRVNSITSVRITLVALRSLRIQREATTAAMSSTTMHDCRAHHIRMSSDEIHRTTPSTLILRSSISTIPLTHRRTMTTARSCNCCRSIIMRSRRHRRVSRPSICSATRTISASSSQWRALRRRSQAATALAAAWAVVNWSMIVP